MGREKPSMSPLRVYVPWSQRRPVPTAGGGGRVPFSPCSQGRELQLAMSPATQELQGEQEGPGGLKGCSVGPQAWSP